uniref:Ankyrin repeat and SOCS box containing 16 n=1 Tax=Cyprinodon variegatus TaxID=28743 RepID=A0A3Q2E9D2_CYPVA
MIRPPLPLPPRLPPRQQWLQEVRAPPPQIRCRDTSIHNTFMYGDIKGVYAVLKDPGMVNALMETVHEEMVWAPEMGMWTLSSKVKQTSALRLAASRGHTACVEELLFRGAEVNTDPGGNTALHDACIGGHSVCVQLLLSHGADPDVLAADGSAPLHLCTSIMEDVNQGMMLHIQKRRFLILKPQKNKIQIEGGADINVRSRESRLTPLHVAAQRAERPSEAGRYLRVIQKLLDAGANPQTAGRKQHTPLHNACANCCPRIVDVLLEHGAKADVENCAGYTPMDCLLQIVEDYPVQQCEAIARSLLNYGAKPVSPKMLKQLAFYPDVLGLMLNSYTSIPPCDWLESLPPDKDLPFFLSVRQWTGQPRSLQHLCRCALRQHLGAQCHSAVCKLDIPASVRDYLLLCNNRTLQ